MKPPKCSRCGVAEWRHICASNTASNGGKSASNGLVSSSGVRKAEPDEVSGQLSAQGLQAVVENKSADFRASGVSVDAVENKKQRWAKDKYNAYQREYMRKRRSKKSENLEAQEAGH